MHPIDFNAFMAGSADGVVCVLIIDWKLDLMLKQRTIR